MNGLIKYDLATMNALSVEALPLLLRIVDETGLNAGTCGRQGGAVSVLISLWWVITKLVGLNTRSRIG